jgi:hypothetical protein
MYCTYGVHAHVLEIMDASSGALACVIMCCPVPCATLPCPVLPRSLGTREQGPPIGLCVSPLQQGFDFGVEERQSSLPCR